MRNLATRHHQQGAVIITVALVLLFLLGFMGIALDFGRLFIVKTELQTAMDSCALAAAQELDLQPSAIDRAKSAGLTAGNLNRVNFQSATWSGKGQLVSAEITFKNPAYVTTADPTVSQYVQCQHVQPAVQMWLMQAMGAFSGNTTDFPSTRNVMASAVATRAHGQTTCPIPVALKPKTTCGGPCPGPNYGLTPGEWVTVLTSQGATPGGYIGWANLDGSNSASETRAEMNGKCGTRVNDILGTPGTQTTIAEDWNYRFGIYKKLPDFSTDPRYMRPDFTGYSYTAANWPSKFNAYNGSDPGAHATAQNFVTKRANFGACAPNGNIKGANSCESINGISLNSFKDLAASGNGPASHGAWGSNRRIVTVPVTDNANKVIDFMCMLMLQPLSIPMADVKLEFIGNAGSPTSPCSFSGMPGGAAGPLVPALVR
ncbi:Putative Flp pilus-assembly TadE/G-like [Polaromonas sp. OV174]|uniref:TadE/TadG family type IV pilus assembly protein n=1 Tax=Polaromonas sp. OV174 TaxID=1855300 RepID=UPI0008EE987A|nr:TadE/TadG family type IV pilus assembly protein [Polaromonas sp. OV174]SFC26565.1 Putative Flp pilus-assembly TadE/G-like [Polaromonas sp. OV174]